MVINAAAQIIKQIDDLKPKVQKKSDLLLDSQAWTDQQKLQSMYHRVLLQDLEYSLDKKLEQDLWNIGFKSYIASLQEITRDKKNSRRSEAQALLTWCLESASGFYLSLLHELCNTFDVDLPFRRTGNIYGQITSATEFNLPQSSSCLYICQYCLVHLGDIARYRNQRKEAESFYKQAILVSPNSGHPYNQLALLEASQGDKLSSVFYYIRSITVKNPFPASTTNLMSMLNSTIDKENPLDKVQRKVTVNEFIHVFLTTHAFLHSATDLMQAEVGIQTLNATLTALVATQSFTSDKLVKITAINLYALKHVTSCCLGNELTEDEKTVRQYVLELLAGSLSAFLVPVHTLKNDDSLLDYYALPAVKLLIYWIKSESDVLKNEVFSKRLQIWPSLCKLLNNVHQYIKDFEYNNYATYPLIEDRALQGFRPLTRCFKELNFKNYEFEDERLEKLTRLKRITDFANFLTTLDINNTKLIVKNETDGITFEPGCIQPDPTNELLEEMKSINIVEISPKYIKKNLEKRGGILKPQGSLEKAREEREQQNTDSIISPPESIYTNTIVIAKKTDSLKPKRSKQNVALQSIFKKIEENKQVKFNVDDSTKETEKQHIFDAAPSPSTSNYCQKPPSFPNQFPMNAPDYIRKNLNQLSMNYQQHSEPDPSHLMKNVPPPSMVPYPNFANNPNKPANFGSTLLMPPPSNSFNLNVNNQGPPYPMQFNNPSGYPYLNDNKGPNPPPWWPNATPPNYQNRHENYQMFNSYGNSGPFMAGSQAEFEGPRPPHSNQPGGDMFNSPWSANWGNLGRNNSFPNAASFNKSGGGLPMQPPEMNSSSRTIGNSDNNMHRNPQGAQGYSLFNTNNMWTPNLGQLRANKAQDSPIHNLPQQSLFSGSGPKSLAQLLEQQQSQKSVP